MKYYLNFQEKIIMRLRMRKVVGGGKRDGGKGDRERKKKAI
jgi:hypothetical protein